MRTKRPFLLCLLACGLAMGASASSAKSPARSTGKAALATCPSQPQHDRRFAEPAPAYPPESIERREEGAAVLGFTVRADGLVEPGSVKITESSGFESLDAAAVKVLEARRYTPACRDGIAVEAVVTDRVRFAIDSPPTNNPYRPAQHPGYPVSAVRLGAEGAVTVTFVVGPDGYVKADTLVITESGGELFDYAVMRTAPNWYFEPARQAGIAVEHAHEFRVVFELRKPPAPPATASPPNSP